MSALRVAVVAACPLPYPRGTPIRVLRLSESLAGLGHDVHVATYHVGMGTADPGLTMSRISGPGWLRPVRAGPTVGKLAVLDPLLFFTLWRMLARHGPFDVIHAHHYEGLILALAARRRTGARLPVVYDAHTLLETELPTYAGVTPRALRVWIGRSLDRTLPRRADHVVTVSDILRERLLAAGLPGSMATTIGNGLEPSAFAAPRNRTPSAPDGGTIVYAGNLADYHRLDLLLEAFAQVTRTRAHATLMIYTNSPAHAVLGHARKLGIEDRVEIRAVPFSELPDKLAEAEIAVNARPICEGVPQKNLNYMAAGLPLVAFRGSLHPYRDGETGVGVAPVSATALGDALTGLLRSPALARRLGAAARQRAQAEFSWHRAAQRVDVVYRQLIDSGRPAGP